MASQKALNRNWKVILSLLYVDMLLLIVRSSYRVAEFAITRNVNSDENLFYSLDALEMLLLQFLWIPLHPGFWNMLDSQNNETKGNYDNVVTDI